MSPTVLVVEDEPAILELIKVNLVDAGYEVQGAADAETAQGLLKAALPDLVLLDWMLPGQSGLAFARQLRATARTRELPIIMVTARTDEADRVAGLEAWVDDYLTKPFSPRELKARIKACRSRCPHESPKASRRAKANGIETPTMNMNEGWIRSQYTQPAHATCSPFAIVSANASRNACIATLLASGRISANALSVPGSMAA